METETVLVTGSSGFIGYYVSKALLELGYSVVGYDNLDDYYEVRLKEVRTDLLKKYEKFFFYEADICNSIELNRAVSEHHISMVIHLAAQAGVRYSLECPGKYIETNIVGTFRILELCRSHGIGSLMYASSSSVYGEADAEKLGIGLRTDAPISLYAATKKSNELLAHVYCNNFGINAVGMRFFTVYGPLGRPDMAYWKFIEKILNGEPIEIYNYGKQYRDFTFIDDLADGIMELFFYCKKMRTGAGEYGIYNIGSGNPVELMAFVETIEKVVGKKANKLMCGKRTGDVEKTYADLSDIQKISDFCPKTGIETGLRKFYSWYQEYHA